MNSTRKRTASPMVRDVADYNKVDARLQYIAARAVGTHAAVDADHHGLLGLADVAGGATQAVANTRANLLKAAMVEHMASVGSETVQGAHKTADTAASATLAAVAAASDLNTSITLVNALLAAVVDHGDQAGVHFHNDPDAVAASITTDPPTTLAHVITDLNDLLDVYNAHFATDHDTINT